MSCGALLIASRTEPVVEVIQDRENGLLVDFLDVHSLAEKLLEVVQNPTHFKHLRIAARDTIKKNYELNFCIEKRIDLIDKLLAQAP